MKKRILSVLLVLTLVIGIVPFSAVNVFAASDDLIWPCESSYYVTCMYYYKNGSKHSTRYGYEKGIDIAGGGNIIAAESGTVETATNLGNTGFGKYVVIKHASGYRTLYAHLSSYSVSVGQTVSKGQKIGVMGSTGSSSGTHLHFEYSGGDPWKTYYNSKYAANIVFEQNVRSNNNTYNSDKTIVNVIDSNYRKSGTYYYYSGQHTHSYTGYYLEATHPHRAYKQCACGATKLISPTEYGTLSSCANCTMTVDSKYNTVKGFKAYPCVSSNFEVKTKDLSTRGGVIYTTDFCTINEIYTNGWCEVTFPMDSGGTRTAYTQISNFIKTPSSSLTKYTATSYINLYSTSSLSTQIYRIYPGDVCYTIGTSGSATQIFMPMSSGGYYVLGWAILPPAQESSGYSVPFKCRTISTDKVVCYNDINFSSSPGKIYPDDDCVITAVYSNGKVQLSCPWSDGTTKTVYVNKSEFINSSTTPRNTTAPKYAKTYLRTDMSTNIGWIDPGDSIQIVGTSGDKTQIIYPADVGKRCAWVYTSDLTQTYTVAYNANGGYGAPSNQSKTQDVDLTLSSTIPTKAGYTFVGWATTSSATTAQYYAGSIYTNNASITLYAVWRKQTFAITYNANGGANAPGAQTQTYGTAITVTTQKPEKTYTVTFNANGGTVNTSYYSLDCTFASWNTNSSGTGTTVNAGSSYTPNANVTLYAKYINPSLGNYPIPSRAGYTFDGWYTAANGGVKLNTTSTIGANTTLYAHWNLETYSVIYFDDGSSNIPSEQTKTYGTALNLSSAVPVKKGYTFKGWATEEGSTTVVYSPGAQYTNNEWVILYPVWEKNPATLANITIKSMPTKTTYKIGDTFDTSGLKLELTYSDSTTEIITTGFTTSGFDSATSGTKTVTVSYGGKTTSFNVMVESVIIDENVPKITVENTTATAGETVQITIVLKNNPGIAGLALSLKYDESVLTLKKTENGGLFSGFTAAKNFAWDESANVYKDGVLATFTFEVAQNAQAGDYAVEVIIRSCTNESLDDIKLSSVNGKVSVVNFIYGDSNGDQKIDMKDVVLLRKYITNFDYDTNTSSVNVGLGADANGDNKIDMKDVVILRKYITNYDYDTESSTVVLGPQ